MWLLILIIIGLVCGGVGYRKYLKSPQYDYYSDVNVWIPAGLLLLSFTLCVAVGVFIAERFTSGKLVLEREAIVQTIESSPEVGEFDKGVILFKAVGFNQKLSERKFWASNWWTRFWVSEKVLQIEPINLKELEL